MEHKCKGMNEKQHFFVWIGIALITFMAIMFDSKLMWLVAAIALITESIYICKDEPLSFWDRKFTLLWLSILLFLILFINFLPGKRKTIPAAPIIRKSNLLTDTTKKKTPKIPFTTSLTLDEMAKTKKESTLDKTDE